MWTYNHADELMHFGVKGMRWGHRRAQQNVIENDYNIKRAKAGMERDKAIAKAKNVAQKTAAKNKYKDAVKEAKLDRDIKISELNGKPYRTAGQKAANAVVTTTKVGVAAVGAAVVLRAAMIGSIFTSALISR